MFVFFPPPPPRPEAVDLGRRIAEAVRILRSEHPSIRDEDVLRGMILAAAELRAELGGGRRAGLLASVLLGLLAAGAFAWYAATGSLPTAVLVALFVAGIFVVALAARGSLR